MPVTKPGQPGFCLICAHTEGWRFIKGVNEGGRKGRGWNAAEALEAARALGFSFSRQTWYAHQEHVRAGDVQTVSVPTKPKERIRPDDLKGTTNIEYLEYLRDASMAKAVNDPEAVTIEQGLKAVSILEGRKEKTSDALNVLIQFVTGHTPAVLIAEPARAALPAGDGIEGEFREIPQEIPA